MSHRIPSVISATFPCDAAVPKNSVVFWSATAGNVTPTTSTGGTAIAGVCQEGSNQSASSPPNYYAKVTMAGIVQVRGVTGTAIACGDLLKVSGTSGQVTKATIAAAGAGTLSGIVGMALSVMASGDATDTLVDCLLTPGLRMYI